MELYFLRHGPAGSMSDWQGPDVERPLTDAGRRVVSAVADGLGRMDVDVDVILTSPYTRAMQTAEIVAERLGVSDRLHTDERLMAGFGLTELQRVLRDHGDIAGLMLVGHEPDFSTLVGELTGGSSVHMKKAAVARVDVEDAEAAGGVLQWLIPPAAFKR